MIPGIALLMLFSIFINSPVHAASPLAPTAKTGQTSCWDERGAVVICTGTGQDGESLTGTAWPSPRFTDNGDQTMTDRLTGMAWTRDANTPGEYKNWQQALDYIKTLNSHNYLGHNDWRLPNINEMESLVNKQPDLAVWLASQGFYDVVAGYYWTSSSYAGYPVYAWTVGMHGGIAAGHRKTDGCLVWSVRTGQPGVLTLPQTGQTECYDNIGTEIDCPGTGQDGELQRGAVWTDPRFKDNGDQTMTDRLTGLVWSKGGSAPGHAACNPGSQQNSQDALDYIKCLNINNYLGKSDWRLPNRNELASLVNRGQANSADWLNSSGFHNVRAGSYWSSSTYPDTTWNAWSVNMLDGAVTSTAKKHEINVWPVRKGQ